MSHCCRNMNVPFHTCPHRKKKKTYLVRKTKLKQEIFDEVGMWTPTPKWFTKVIKKLKRKKQLIIFRPNGEEI